MTNEENQPTIAELLARIEDLEGKPGRKSGGLRRLFGKKVAVIVPSVALVLGLVAASAFASGPPAIFWNLTGNSGTNPTTNYIGTSDANGLSIRTNGTEAIGIDTSQNVTVQKSLNAMGGLQENGVALSSKYARGDGSNATGSWPIGISGNAATVTNGLYSTGSYADPSWLTSLAGSKVSGNITGDAAGFTGSLSGDVSGGQNGTAVTGLQGMGIATTAPTDGQVLRYSATDGKWEPGNPAATSGTSAVNLPFSPPPISPLVTLPGLGGVNGARDSKNQCAVAYQKTTSDSEIIQGASELSSGSLTAVDDSVAPNQTVYLLTTGSSLSTGPTGGWADAAVINPTTGKAAQLSMGMGIEVTFPET